MEDEQILDLYFRREETAITETDRKHGPFCRRMAGKFLSDRRDAEECVSDTWLAAWNQIPPERPLCLRAFLGRIVRNLSISRLRQNSAAKRGAGLEVMLSELDECVPSADFQRQLEAEELADLIRRWLDGLSQEERVLFVRRYWMGETVKDLAAFHGGTANQMARRMQRLRQSLKEWLEQEGAMKL